MPFVAQKAGERSRGIVVNRCLPDLVPVGVDDRKPIRRTTVGVQTMRGEGIEIEMRTGNLVTALNAALGVPQFVVVVDLAPVELIVGNARTPLVFPCV